MCSIGHNVRMGITQPGGSGVCGWSGHHRRNGEQERTGGRLQGETDIPGRIEGGAQQSRAVHQTHGHSTEGVRSPGPDNRGTETNHGPAGTAVPIPRVWSLGVPTTAGSIETGTGGSQEHPEDGRSGRGPLSRIGWFDTRRQTVREPSPSPEDAVSECAILGGSGSPSSPPSTGRPRTEVSQPPGLSTIRSNWVESLDCSTSNGHTTQARKLSQWPVEDVVCIQLPEGSRLRPDFATHSCERRDRAGRPTSFYKTPGSSIWVPRPSSYHRTEHAGDWTNEPRVLSVPCWVPSNYCRFGLESFGLTECPTNGVFRRNKGLLHVEWYGRQTSCVCDCLVKAGY